MRRYHGSDRLIFWHCQFRCFQHNRYLQNHSNHIIADNDYCIIPCISETWYSSKQLRYLTRIISSSGKMNLNGLSYRTHMKRSSRRRNGTGAERSTRSILSAGALKQATPNRCAPWCIVLTVVSEWSLPVTTRCEVLQKAIRIRSLSAHTTATLILSKRLLYIGKVFFHLVHFPISP